jgi:predicted RNase H-like nuclease (RuvC/YqgF family)
MNEKLVSIEKNQNYTLTQDAISQRQQNSRRNQKRKAMERLLELMNLKTNDQILLNQIVNMLNQVFEFEHILEIYRQDFDEYMSVHPFTSVKNDEISHLKESCDCFESELKATRIQINTLKETIASLEKQNSKLRHRLVALKLSETHDGAESTCSVRSYLKIKNNL